MKWKFSSFWQRVDQCHHVLHMGIMNLVPLCGVAARAATVSSFGIPSGLMLSCVMLHQDRRSLVSFTFGSASSSMSTDTFPCDAKSAGMLAGTAKSVSDRASTWRNNVNIWDNKKVLGPFLWVSP